MKKNYIAPNTVAATWTSMGLMVDPVINMSSASGGAGAQQTGNIDYIQ